MKTTEQKVILGKLLSTENIIVDYSAECQNPYFDVTARRLVLPQWASLDEDVEDLMIGHEVGHALYTDPFKWHAALDEYDGKTQRIFKQVLNIVEDVRIEKNIQRKYPGLRRTMIAGYGVLLRDGFFGVKTEKEMHDLVFADRANLHFKLGARVLLKFEDEAEKQLIAEMDAVQTFEDVVTVAKKLFQHHQHETSDLPEAGQPDQVYEWGGTEGYMSGQKETEILTDSPLDSFCRVSFNGTATESLQRIVKLNIPSLEECVIPSKILYDSIKMTTPDHRISNPLLFTAYARFVRKNKAKLDQMVREFEVKKAAHMMDKKRTARTGKLDMNRLWKNKFTDDMFLNTTIIPQAKNHGMIMLLDFSASMCRVMKNTLQQAINFAIFCQRVNIPFEMYAFSDTRLNLPGYHYAGGNRTLKNDHLNLRPRDEAFRLHQLLHSGMDKNTFKMAVGILLATAGTYNRLKEDLEYFVNELGFPWSTGPFPTTPHNLTLGGTPLAEATLALFAVTQNFKKTYAPEVLNVVVLSDGDATSSLVDGANAAVTLSTKTMVVHKDAKIHGADYKKVIERNAGALMPYVLLELLRKTEKVNVLGYFLVEKTMLDQMAGGYLYNSRELSHANFLMQIADKFKGYVRPQQEIFVLEDLSTKHNLVSIDILGFDSFFIMALDSASSSPRGWYSINSKRKSSSAKTLKKQEIENLTNQFSTNRINEVNDKIFINRFTSSISKNLV